MEGINREHPFVQDIVRQYSLSDQETQAFVQTLNAVDENGVAGSSPQEFFRGITVAFFVFETLQKKDVLGITAKRGRLRVNSELLARLRRNGYGYHTKPEEPTLAERIKMPEWTRTRLPTHIQTTNNLVLAALCQPNKTVLRLTAGDIEEISEKLSVSTETFSKSMTALSDKMRLFDITYDTDETIVITFPKVGSRMPEMQHAQPQAENSSCNEEDNWESAVYPEYMPQAQSQKPPPPIEVQAAAAEAAAPTEQLPGAQQSFLSCLAANLGERLDKEERLLAELTASLRQQRSIVNKLRKQIVTATARRFKPIK